MGKKKQPVAVNNINQLNLEIDYDKLAEAIVRALEKAKEPPKDSEVAKRKRVWLAVRSILKGEKSNDGRFLAAPFAFVVSIVFRVVALMGALAITVFDFGVVYSLVMAEWQGVSIAANIVIIIISFALTVAGLLYMVVFWGAANDVEHEKDKNYVISVFSGLMSVAALIVAIISLYKGIS